MVNGVSTCGFRKCSKCTHVVSDPVRLAGPEPKGPKEFDCRLHNLSNGGVCILSSSPLQASTFVCCNFQVFDSPVAIPALMQVRWTVKRGQKSPSYISGLEFVV